VAIGIPFMPGTTKGRFRMAKRGGHVEDARPIPVLSALVTFAEPPWLAGLSAFNVLDTEADDPAYALAEDTKFGIMGVFNPPLYPNTPAISIHLKNYVEEQYERRLFGENSLKTAAQVGKGFSVLSGMNNLFSHPVFLLGDDEAVGSDWKKVLDNVFNANAMKRDEIAYEGAGRGSGWLNYIIFGYSLYGHLAERIGPFAPGVGQAVRQIQYINELDSKMNGRLLKIIRYLQITADKPMFNGLYGVDFRLALSIVKGLEQMEVQGKTTDNVIDELIQFALREAVSKLNSEDRQKAYESFQAGNNLLGQDLAFPVDLLEKSPIADSPAGKVDFELTQNEQQVISDLLAEGYTQADIDEILVNIIQLPVETRLSALKNIKQVTLIPAHKLEGAKDTLWQFRFTKAIPRAILGVPAAKKLLKTVFNITMIAGSVMLWGYWAMAIPMMFMIFEAMGMFKGTPLKIFLRLFFGGISVVAMVLVSGGLGALSIPQLGLLYLYFTGGEKGANYLLYMIDRIPISIMAKRTNQYNILSLEDKLNFLRENDKFDPEMKRSIVKRVIEAIAQRPQTTEEYDRQFRQEFILASLEQAYIVKLRKYYHDIYGEDADNLENDIQNSLSKFAVDQRLRIVKKIYERLTGSFSRLDAMSYLLTKIKPGDEMPYKSKFGFFRKIFTDKQKEKVFRATALTIVSASAIFLLGMPQTLLGLFAFALINSIVLFIGTRTFEQTFGAVAGVMWPILHAAVSPYSASNMPLVIIMAEILDGYMIGSSFGLLLKNSIELIYNFVINPFAVKPYKAFGALDKISAKSDRIKQRILLASIVPLINEVDSDLEFKSKFDRLYFDTIESVTDYDDGAEAIDGQQQDLSDTPPAAPDVSPDSNKTSVIAQTPGTASGQSIKKQTHQSRLYNISRFIASELNFSDFELNNLSGALDVLADTEGGNLDKSIEFTAGINRASVRLSLSNMISINRSRKRFNLDKETNKAISAEDRAALDKSVDDFETVLMDISKRLASRVDESYIEVTENSFYSKDMILEAVNGLKQAEKQRWSQLQLSENIRNQKSDELEIRFNKLVEDINNLFDFYNQMTNNLINGIIFAASTIESSVSIAEAPFGLAPILERAAADGKISRQIFDAVIKWIFVDENRTFISLIADSRNKTGDLSLAGMIDYLIAQEIRPYKNQYVPHQADKPSKRIDVLPEAKKPEMENVTSGADQIFQTFNPKGNVEKFADYLESYNRNSSFLPSVDSILSNPFFNKIPRGSFNPSRVLETVMGLVDESGLDYTHAVQLIKVLEDSGYMLSVMGQKDLIIIDLDTLGLSSVENKGNQNLKVVIEQYIDALRARYAQANRQVDIMLFSGDLNSYDINRRIGEGLRRKIDLVYGNELFDEISAVDSSEKFIRFFMERVSNQNVNRLNMKVFSNRYDIMDAAQDMGAILADRTGNIFDALKVFANLHPAVGTTNLYAVSEDIKAVEALKTGNITLLGGQEISVNPNKSLLNRKIFTHLIDRAA